MYKPAQNLPGDVTFPAWRAYDAQDALLLLHVVIMPFPRISNTAVACDCVSRSKVEMIPIVWGELFFED
jgi:hypothetical protein